MSRLIDADALYKQISEEAAFRLKQAWRETESAEARGMIETLERIANAPTIEPKRGEWKDCQWFDEHYGRCYECNVCEGTVIGKQNFCPNCGADMRENEKE